MSAAGGLRRYNRGQDLPELENIANELCYSGSPDAPAEVAVFECYRAEWLEANPEAWGELWLAWGAELESIDAGGLLEWAEGKGYESADEKHRAAQLEEDE